MTSRLFSRRLATVAVVSFVLCTALFVFPSYWESRSHSLVSAYWDLFLDVVTDISLISHLILQLHPVSPVFHSTVSFLEMDPSHDHMHHAMVENSSLVNPTVSSHIDHSTMDHHSMGHGGMDHGSMDHGSMDHGSMDHGGMHHGHMMMKMYFHFTLNDYVLFDFWKVDSYGSLISSMIGIFIAAMLYEGLKYTREYLYWKNYSMLQYQTVNKPTNQENDRVINNLVSDVIHRQPPSLMSAHHLIQTFLHIIQIFVSYLLMLIFMTYNVWLCIAVTLGSATGYFFFGWRKSLFVDVTEHCH